MPFQAVQKAMAKPTSNYNGTWVGKYFLKKLKDEFHLESQNVRDVVLKQLAYIGEQCVTIARQDHPNNWGDRTGNLRSSIGYVVLWNGKPVINADFSLKSGPKGNGSEGEAQGRKLLKQLESKYPQGAVLIIAAGMNYASYVESVHHKDVLSSAGLKAEELLNSLFNEIAE